MVSTFADGEPVDPQKLRDLQAQISEIKAISGNAYNLISTTVNGVKQESVIHTVSGVIEIENVKSGSEGNVSTGHTWNASDYTDFVTVATPKLQSPKTDEVRVSIKGEQSPIVHYYFKSSTGTTKELLRINWISTAKRIISQ